MSSTAKVTIGGKEYELQPLVFSQMRKVWPFLQKHAAKASAPQLDPNEEGGPDVAGFMASEMEAAEDVIQIMAIALRDPEKDADWISDNLLASEVPLLQPAMLDLLEISGLTGGNAGQELAQMADQFLKDQKPSTETSTS